VERLDFALVHDKGRGEERQRPIERAKMSLVDERMALEKVTMAIYIPRKHFLTSV
jgi:hypothetical protein